MADVITTRIYTGASVKSDLVILPLGFIEGSVWCKKFALGVILQGSRLS